MAAGIPRGLAFLFLGIVVACSSGASGADTLPETAADAVVDAVAEAEPAMETAMGAEAETEACVPDCTDKYCGDSDGCDGVCNGPCPGGGCGGSCEWGVCYSSCDPACGYRVCGPSACAGCDCGTCPEGEICVDGVCACPFGIPGPCGDPPHQFGNASAVDQVFVAQDSDVTGQAGTTLEGAACLDLDADGQPNNGLAGLIVHSGEPGRRRPECRAAGDDRRGRAGPAA
jgi:hypothetical protein